VKGTGAAQRAVIVEGLLEKLVGCRRISRLAQECGPGGLADGQSFPLTGLLADVQGFAAERLLLRQAD